MLKYYSFDIVFAEIPDEVTLAVNISGCPNLCEGCHSPWLREDKGNELNERTIDNLMSVYGAQITCFCFMGGDAQPEEVEHLACYIHSKYADKHIAWYSGKPNLSKKVHIQSFDYIKIGPYIPEFGPLNQRTTNQKLFRIIDEVIKDDITYRFWK